jgi:hypothetical protein
MPPILIMIVASAASASKYAFIVDRPMSGRASSLETLALPVAPQSDAT